MAARLLNTHARRAVVTTVTAVTTTAPSSRAYQPRSSSRAAPPRCSRVCSAGVLLPGQVLCVCGVSTPNEKSTVECVQCNHWSHIQCARLTKRTAKQSQFLCHQCRPTTTTTRGKKGSTHGRGELAQSQGAKSCESNALTSSSSPLSHSLTAISQHSPSHPPQPPHSPSLPATVSQPSTQHPVSRAVTPDSPQISIDMEQPSHLLPSQEPSLTPVQILPPLPLDISLAGTPTNHPSASTLPPPPSCDAITHAPTTSTIQTRTANSSLDTDPAPQSLRSILLLPLASVQSSVSVTSRTPVSTVPAPHVVMRANNNMTGSRTRAVTRSVASHNTPIACFTQYRHPAVSRSRTTPAIRLPPQLTTRGSDPLPGRTQPTQDGFEQLAEEIKHALRSEFNARILSLEDEVFRLTSLTKALSEKIQRSAALASLAHSCIEKGQRSTLHPSEAVPQSTNPPPLPIRIGYAQTAQPSLTTGPGCGPRTPNTLPFRIVWGTQGSCSSLVVHKAICTLLPNTLWGSITVKRSVRRRDGRLMWWFTIMAPDEVMQQITNAWHILESRTSWFLLQSLSSRPSRLNNHPHPNRNQVPLLSQDHPTSSSLSAVNLQEFPLTTAVGPLTTGLAQSGSSSTPCTHPLYSPITQSDAGSNPPPVGMTEPPPINSTQPSLSSPPPTSCNRTYSPITPNDAGSSSPRSPHSFLDHCPHLFQPPGAPQTNPSSHQ